MLFLMCFKLFEVVLNFREGNVQLVYFILVQVYLHPSSVKERLIFNAFSTFNLFILDFLHRKATLYTEATTYTKL